MTNAVGRLRGDAQTWRKDRRFASLVRYGVYPRGHPPCSTTRVSFDPAIPERPLPRIRLSHALIGAIFVVAGVMHFVIPGSYERIMPPWLPAHHALVLLSGVAEVAGGVGVLVPRTRRAAGWGLILLLVAVWPANFQMLLNARASGASSLAQTLLVLRLPLQLALMAWVWRTCTRRG